MIVYSTIWFRIEEGYEITSYLIILDKNCCLPTLCGVSAILSDQIIIFKARTMQFIKFGFRNESYINFIRFREV